MKQASFRIEGLRPLLMCNVRLADPTDPFTRRLAEINHSKARGKEFPPEVLEERLNVQWEGGLYWDKTMGVYLPTYNLEACLIEGAKKFKRGNDAKLVSVFGSNGNTKGAKVHSPVGFPDTLNLEAYRKHENGHLTRVVCMNKTAKVLARRPMIPEGWTAEFTVEYDPEYCCQADLAKWLAKAGEICGIGTWRPKFGRFVLS